MKTKLFSLIIAMAIISLSLTFAQEKKETQKAKGNKIEQPAAKTTVEKPVVKPEPKPIVKKVVGKSAVKSSTTKQTENVNKSKTVNNAKDTSIEKEEK